MKISRDKASLGSKEPPPKGDLRPTKRKDMTHLDDKVCQVLGQAVSIAEGIEDRRRRRLVGSVGGEGSHSLNQWRRKRGYQREERESERTKSTAAVGMRLYVEDPLLENEL